MLFQNGAPSSSGFSTTPTSGPEFLDFAGVYTLAASGTLKQGQVLCYNGINIPDTNGADKLILPTSANAARAWGVYQGPAITNPSSTATLSVTIQIRIRGYGVVLCSTTASGTGSTAITVGAFLIIGANGTAIPNAYAGSAAAGVTVGMALATSPGLTYGSTILAGSTAATGLVNALITVG